MPPLPVNRLLPPGPPASTAEVIENLGLDAPLTPAAAEAQGPARPRVLLNMVSTLDGRATIGGRSGPIGNRADRELFHALRSVVDAVLVGAGTARAERYGRLVREESVRERRLARGLAAEPLASRWAPRSHCSPTRRRAWRS
jgi:hypothetical protein